MNTIPTIPKILPIIPIKNRIILPGLALRLQITRQDVTQLIQRNYKADGSKETKYIVGCVPIQPSTTTTNNTVLSTRVGNKFSSSKKTLDETSDQTSDLHEYGCAAQIIRLERTIGGFIAILEGIARIRIEKYIHDRPNLEAEVTVLSEPAVPNDDQESKELVDSLKSTGRNLLEVLKGLNFPTPLLTQLQRFIDTAPAGSLADFLVNMIDLTYEEKLDILDAHDLKKRITNVINLLNRQIQLKEEFGEREYSSIDDDDVADLIKRLQAAGLSAEADRAAQRELKRLKRMHPTQAEYQIVRTYLETLSEIPWSKSTTDILDINKARQQLEDDHYGLMMVKKRVLEYLAVLKLKDDMKGPILCLQGPPGVGKTSLGKSIANALGRKFHRISLGGVRDEAEIRGHRRTYIGAMPGLIAQGLRRVGVNNPIFLLDEIDKVGHLSNHGDPSAALLEVLDPEQNNTFSDHYLNVPLDLSKVLFIATANQIDSIPPPLLDRMEVISIPGYTFDEKIHIAKRHLLPKQIASHGLSPGDIKISDDVLLKIAVGYTREAGVRNLEREIASICRTKAVEYANAKDNGEIHAYGPEVNADDVESTLGVERFDNEVAERVAKPGVVTGMAWTPSGSGSILFIEATQMPGKGNILMTGKLGDVIKESAQIALSWVRAHSFQLGIATSTTDSTFFFQRDVHIHFPSGAVNKDGPSAGIALTTALVSLFTRRCVPPTTAMTGEITLRGLVLPVGGIKEKIIAAHRAGIKKVILPSRNRKEVEGDVPVNVKEGIVFVYANNIYDVLQAAFEGKKIWMEDPSIVEVESHL